MFKIKQKPIYIIWCLCLCLCQCIQTCEIEENGLKCPSLEAAIVASITKRNPNLKVLNIHSYESTPKLTRVKTGTFLNYGYITDLRITNVANGIERGAFNGLDSLYELHFDNNKIHVIPPQIFQNVPTSYIFVFNCEVQEISPKAFDKLPNLFMVYFYGNQIDTIIEGVFTGTKITKLILMKNRIRNIEPNAFGDMPKLKQLSLSENELTSFDPRIAIGSAPTLDLLYIDNNKIQTTTRNMYSMMPNLGKLLMNRNNIQTLDNRTFFDLLNLRFLDISNNNLEELDSSVFNSARHKYLDSLLLHNNKLTFLSNELLTYFPNLKYVSIGGNPWQCACKKNIDDFLKTQNINKICYEKYTDGNRPVCVTSTNEPKNCIYDVDKVKDILEIFEEATKDYDKLPTNCNIDNNGKYSLDSYYSYNIF